jgi:osmotically inducible protein OsmC
MERGLSITLYKRLHRFYASGDLLSLRTPDVSNIPATTSLPDKERRLTMPVRHSEGIWEGTLKNGQGKMRIGSNGFEVDYSFPSRFDSSVGTNPEELLGAAHAGCFSMALSLFVGEAGFTQSSIHTRASVHLDKSKEGFAISRIELETTADIPGMDEQAFMDLAEKAKTNCPVSRALASVEIFLDAKLERDQSIGRSVVEKPEEDFSRAPAEKPRSTDMPK